MEGTIANLVVERGFGFIRPKDGGPDAFFHMSAVVGLDFDRRLIGQRVTFEMITGRDNRPRAESVRAAA